MNYGLPAFLIGWFLTFFLFCLGLTVANMVAEAAAGAEGASGGGLGLNFLPITLMYGFPVAAIVGLPLAIVVATLLRRVRRQWIHVAVFAGVLGAAVAAVMGVFAARNDGDWQAPVIMGAWAGCCAAAGRASVIGMVAARNRPVVNSH